MNLKQELREKLSIELRRLRQEKGLSLQDVALQTPLSMNMIALMEQGKPLAARHYQRLLKFYGKKLEFTIKNI